jgi:hypothetical protein
VAADLDHDGRPDLAGLVGALGEPGAVVLLHNRGDGTFEPWRSVPVGAMPEQVVAGDFNGDHAPDLAILHNHNVGSPPPLDQPYLTILYNDGSGAFPTRSEYANQRLITAGSLAAADFDGDGRLDLAFPDYGAHTALVALNHGDGTFETPLPYGAAGDGHQWPAAVLAGDFDRDGRPDLLALQNERWISFLPNLSCGRCWANCDQSGAPPVLNAGDFVCFLSKFAAGDPSANCDQSTRAPVLNVGDLLCFMQKFAAGCP